MVIGSAFVYFQIIGDEWMTKQYGLYLISWNILREKKIFMCIGWLIDWPPQNRIGEKIMLFCWSHEDKSV